MAQEVLSSALLMIATIIASVALVNAVYPSIFTMTGSISMMTNSVDQRMKSEISVIFESSPNTNTLYVWVKNIGKTEIPQDSLQQYTDIFYGSGSGAMSRAVYNGSENPKWAYSIESGSGDGDTSWDPGETIKMTITTTGEFTPGDHRVRIILPNKVYCEDTFSV
jgi:flagellar protein FlaG